MRALRKSFRESLKAYLFLLPSFAILGTFVFWPLVFSFVLSFFKWDFAHQKDPKFIGLKNYMKLFELREPLPYSLLQSLGYTMMYISLCLVIVLFLYTIIKREKIGSLYFASVLNFSSLFLSYMFQNSYLLLILWSVNFLALILVMIKARFKRYLNQHLLFSIVVFVFLYIFLRKIILPEGNTKDIFNLIARIKDDSDFIKSIYNTTYYVLLSTPTTVFLSLGVALLLNHVTHFKGFYRTSYFIPFVTSIVAISLVWQWIFNDEYGLLNYILSWFNISKIPWLKDEKWTIPTIAIVSIWKNLGYDAVIFLAGLQSIDKSYYEAAEVDGAKRYQKFFYITWPLLSPTTFFILVVSMIGNFKVFTTVYVLYNQLPGPYNQSGLTVVYYVFRKFYQEQKMGEACAIAYMLFLIILILTIVQLRIGKEKVQYEN
ncbi:MAG: sugar ABC transporter permease [Thermotogae bacterium]|nr:sugar ABC transporter permease [Thermotogota bacterium]